MYKVLLKVEQNGGEYYGHVSIKCKDDVSVCGKNVVVDGVELEFDEYVEVVSIQKIREREQRDE